MYYYETVTKYIMYSGNSILLVILHLYSKYPNLLPLREVPKTKEPSTQTCSNIKAVKVRILTIKQQCISI